MSGARQALSFLTPIGGAATPSPQAFRWFPLVGAAIGAALGGIWWVAGEVWPPAVAAAVVVAADLALTGLLHLDGLADSADGLLPHLTREQRLSVMAAPDVGAFGVGVAGAVLLLRWSALATINPNPALLAGVWCASRTLMATVAGTVPYARDEGLATAFLGGTGVWVVAVAGAVAAIALAGWAALGVLAGLAVVALALRRVGGFTGDVLGAAGVIGETVGLLVAAA
jgi:adenosylcobinamide-GDP ribazoletransferase